MISGYVVTFSKQFRTGDMILMDGQYGTIEDITPIHTVIKLWDWRRYVVPNARMLTKEAIHYTKREGLLWALLKFNVAFGADLDRVEEIAVEAGKKSPLRTGRDDPKFWVMGMGRESMECWLAMWTKGPVDAWTFRVEVAGRIARQMAKEGIRSHSFEVRRDGPMPPPASLAKSRGGSVGEPGHDRRKPDGPVGAGGHSSEDEELASNLKKRGVRPSPA
ncbi:MAG: mechanosensitive ion channel family protein [Opitutales bacterium]